MCSYCEQDCVKYANRESICLVKREVRLFGSLDVSDYLLLFSGWKLKFVVFLMFIATDQSFLETMFVMMTVVDPCFATQKQSEMELIEHVWLVVISADNTRPIARRRDIGFVINGPWSRRLRTET